MAMTLNNRRRSQGKPPPTPILTTDIVRGNKIKVMLVSRIEMKRARDEEGEKRNESGGPFNLGR